MTSESAFQPNDVVEVVSLGHSVITNDMVGLLGAHGIVVRGSLSVPGNVEVAHQDKSWVWDKADLKLRVRIGSEYVLRSPRIPRLYGLSPEWWDRNNGKRFKVVDVQMSSDQGSFVGIPHKNDLFATGAGIKGALSAAGVEGTYVVPACCLFPTDSTEMAKPSLDSVLERLYDAFRTQEDCSALLSEYKAITGKDRPRFMGGK